MSKQSTGKKKERADHGKSPRAGLRTVKGKQKTAKALGSNYAVTGTWRDRKQEGDY